MNQEQSRFRPVQVVVDNQQVHARVGGAGPPIILLHSLLADDSSFDRIATPLAQTHYVVILKLPGFGASARVDGGLEKVADRVAAAIKGLALKQQPILLGNGYGGFVALQVAIRHPEIAQRLVLADCGAVFAEPGRAAFRNMSSIVKEKGLAAVADTAMRRLFSPEYQTTHQTLIEERRQRFMTVDIETFHNACLALSNLDLRADLHLVKVPVLVLVGEHDEATPPAMAHQLAAGLSDARLEVLRGCAHVPQLQDPELFLSTIRQFIATKADERG